MLFYAMGSFLDILYQFYVGAKKYLIHYLEILYAFTILRPEAFSLFSIK